MFGNSACWYQQLLINYLWVRNRLHLNPSVGYCTITIKFPSYSSPTLKIAEIRAFSNHSCYHVNYRIDAYERFKSNCMKFTHGFMRSVLVGVPRSSSSYPVRVKLKEAILRFSFSILSRNKSYSNRILFCGRLLIVGFTCISFTVCGVIWLNCGFLSMK